MGSGSGINKPKGAPMGFIRVSQDDWNGGVIRPSIWTTLDPNSVLSVVSDTLRIAGSGTLSVFDNSITSVVSVSNDDTATQVDLSILLADTTNQANIQVLLWKDNNNYASFSTRNTADGSNLKRIVFENGVPVVNQNESIALGNIFLLSYEPSTRTVTWRYESGGVWALPIATHVMSAGFNLTGTIRTVMTITKLGSWDNQTGVVDNWKFFKGIPPTPQ